MEDSRTDAGAAFRDRPDSGLSRDALRFLAVIDRFHQVAEAVLGADGREKLHWQIISEIIVNDFHGRHTVTKNIVDTTGRANATVRTVLDSFERHGLIVEVQRVGRSILYSPTPKLLALLNEVGESMMTHCRELLHGGDRSGPNGPVRASGRSSA